MEKMKLSNKLEYGLGTVGKSLSYGLISGRIMYYFNNVLKVNQSFAASLFLFGRLWDGINDLLMGTVIDNTKSRLGKFRPWILIGSVTNAIVVVGMFYYRPGISAGALMVYLTIMYLLQDATYTMVDVGYWSMIPALSLDPRERESISLVPRLCSGAAGIIFMFAPQIMDTLGGMDELNQGFLKYALSSSCVYIATSVYSGIRVKERVEPPKEQKDSFSLPQAAKTLFGNKQALVVAVMMILFNLGNNLTGEAAQFYFLNVLDDEKNLLTIFTALMGVGSFIGLAGFPLLSKKMGRHKVYIASLAAPLVGYAIMVPCLQLLPNPSLQSIASILPLVVSVIFTSAGYGSMGVMQNVMLADAVDYGEYETGQRNEGIIFSTLTLISKVAAGLGSATTMNVFRIVKFGGNYSTDTRSNPRAVFGIKFSMSMLPPLIVAIALFLYFKYFKLKPEFMEQVSGEIQRRRTEVNAEPV